MSSKLTTNQIHQYLEQLQLPESSSHKGDNGKLLIIGGSELFHAASRWSLDISSKFVDMIFYSSVHSNNALIKEAKQNFWNGIVVPRMELEKYLVEADCVLIGPGMERFEPNQKYNLRSRQFYIEHPPNKDEWQADTQKITNYLLAKYADKKWVIDAGALQMVSPNLLTDRCIITPHRKELEQLLENGSEMELDAFLNAGGIDLAALSQQLNQTAILLKGPIDTIAYQQQSWQVEGGNAGMTKGGTGDVLAGLIAGLYTNNQLLPSLIAASYINKKAGDALFEEVGPFYNASDLLNKIPQVLWEEIKQAGS